MMSKKAWVVALWTGCFAAGTLWSQVDSPAPPTDAASAMYKQRLRDLHHQDRPLARLAGSGRTVGALVL